MEYQSATTTENKSEKISCFKRVEVNSVVKITHLNKKLSLNTTFNKVKTVHYQGINYTNSIIKAAKLVNIRETCVLVYRIYKQMIVFTLELKIA